MSLPTNYATLKTWLLDWIDRADLTASAEDFIRLAEGEMDARMKIRHNEVSSTVSLTSGTSTVALPADYLEMITLTFSNDTVPPLKRDRGFIDALRNDSAQQSGKPSFYHLGTTSIDFERPADQTYTMPIRYYARWNLNNSSAGAVWLLANRPAIYLGLSLRRAAPYLKDVNAAQFWTAEADRDIAQLIDEDRRDRMQGRYQRVDAALVGRGAYNIFTDQAVGRE